MYELPRYMHVVTYHINELYINIWSLFTRRVNLYMYIFGGRIYVYIKEVHAYRESTYIYMEFIHNAGEYLYI